MQKLDFIQWPIRLYFSEGTTRYKIEYKTWALTINTLSWKYACLCLCMLMIPASLIFSTHPHFQHNGHDPAKGLRNTACKQQKIHMCCVVLFFLQRRAVLCMENLLIIIRIKGPILYNFPAVIATGMHLQLQDEGPLEEHLHLQDEGPLVPFGTALVLGSWLGWGFKSEWSPFSCYWGQGKLAGCLSWI